MYHLQFVFSAAGFILLTLFVASQYPESWKKNRMFIAVLAVWHLIGMF